MTEYLLKHEAFPDGEDAIRSYEREILAECGGSERVLAEANAIKLSERVGFPVVLEADGVPVLRAEGGAGVSLVPEVPVPRVLSVGDAVRLGEIVEACIQCQPVTFLEESGRIASYVARAITDAGGAHLGSGVDVRDGFVWLSGIFERFVPVMEVMEGVKNGTVALNDRLDEGGM